MSDHCLEDPYLTETDTGYDADSEGWNCPPLLSIEPSASIPPFMIPDSNFSQYLTESPFSLNCKADDIEDTVFGVFEPLYTEPLPSTMWLDDTPAHMIISELETPAPVREKKKRRPKRPTPEHIKQTPEYKKLRERNNKYAAEWRKRNETSLVKQKQKTVKKTPPCIQVLKQNLHALDRQNSSLRDEIVSLVNQIDFLRIAIKAKPAPYWSAFVAH